MAGEPPAGAQPPAAATPPADAGSDDSRSSDPLKAERRKTNHLEKEIRTLRQQLNRFSEINPEEYARLQEAERQKQILEERMELRERQMEEASAQKVAAVAAERDEARSQVLQLRKDRRICASSSPMPSAMTPLMRPPSPPPSAMPSLPWNAPPPRRR